MPSSRFVYYTLALVALWLVTAAGSVWAGDSPSAEQRNNNAKNSAMWIKGVLEGAIQFNPHLRDTRVKVSVEGHNATLRGFVRTSTAKELVGQIAAHVKGINKVHNFLEVAPEKLKSIGEMSDGLIDTKLSNVTISNKVRSQLLANRTTSGINVEIETHNRIVTMTGQVKDEAEKELAYWVVRNTQGVKEVVNNLDIDESVNRHALITLEQQDPSAPPKETQ